MRMETGSIFKIPPFFFEWSGLIGHFWVPKETSHNLLCISSLLTKLEISNVHWELLFKILYVSQIFRNISETDSTESPDSSQFSPKVDRPLSQSKPITHVQSTGVTWQNQLKVNRLVFRKAKIMKKRKNSPWLAKRHSLTTHTPF